MQEIFLVTESLFGSFGNGKPGVLLLEKGTVLYRDEDCTFDENTVDYKIYPGGQFAQVGREKKLHSPKGVYKYTTNFPNIGEILL